MAAPSKQTVRLQKDLDGFQKNPLPFLQDLKLSVVEPDDSKGPSSAGQNRLSGVMIGPENTPYEGGHFRFELTFPPQYPFQPPEFVFKTAILHPNVHSGDGIACHHHLLATWAPTVSLAKFLTEMHGLLRDPDFDTPADKDPIVEKTAEMAREWTKNFAAPTQ